jgi:hypothetical protein
MSRIAVQLVGLPFGEADLFELARSLLPDNLLRYDASLLSD